MSEMALFDILEECIMRIESGQASAADCLAQYADLPPIWNRS